MDYRLFAALDMPDEIVEQLVDLQGGLDGAGWRPRENFHLTLRFFGPCDGAVARDLDHELGQIMKAPFELRLSGVGAFGGNDPHSIWAGVAEDGPLRDLASACDRAARRCGFSKDKHPYRPHVTLAYLKGFTSFQVAEWLQRFSVFETSSFEATHFSLFSSWPGRYASRYREEATYPLLR